MERVPVGDRAEKGALAGSVRRKTMAKTTPELRVVTSAAAGLRYGHE